MTVTLRAKWEDEQKTWDQMTKMQEMTTNACNEAPIGSTKNLTDTRDGNTYKIFKANDGNCWMQENLRLSGNRTLTQNDSDVLSDTFLPTEISNGDVTSDTKMQIFNTNDSSYCRLYNFPAATAGSGMSDLSTGHASSSICAKGWQLPNDEIETANKSWCNMLKAHGATSTCTYGAMGNGYIADTVSIIMANPILLTKSGWYEGSSWNEINRYGFYWSRSINPENHKPFSLYFLYQNWARYDHSEKSWGMNVRCVAK